MLVVDLGVVHARAPRLVRVLVPGLVVDPAHVLVQGLEARAAAVPGLVIDPSRRASLVPVRRGSRDPSLGQAPKEIAIVPSPVASPRIGTVPSHVTNP